MESRLKGQAVPVSDNPDEDIGLNIQESAEAIVGPVKAELKGRTVVTGRTIMIQKQEAESKDNPKAIVKGEHPEGVRSNNGANTSVPITKEPTPVVKYDCETSVTIGTAEYGAVRTVV